MVGIEGRGVWLGLREEVCGSDIDGRGVWLGLREEVCVWD